MIGPMTDLGNGFILGQDLAPVSANTTGNGAGLDFANAGLGRTQVIINNGVVTGSAIWTIQVQCSDDNVTYANEGDPNALSGNISAAGITKLDYIRTKRYARCVRTLVSGTSSILCIEMLAAKKYAPAGSGVDLAPTSVT